MAQEGVIVEHAPPLRWRGRYLESFLGAARGGDDPVTEGRVMLIPVSVPNKLTVDQIIYVKGSAIAGNVRAGIYRDPDADLPDGDLLLVDSGNVAVPGGATRKHAVPITPTVIEPPIVYGALEFDDATMEVEWAASGAYRGDEPTTRYYDQVFGAFTDPCPVTALLTLAVHLWIRVVV